MNCGGMSHNSSQSASPSTISQRKAQTAAKVSSVLETANRANTRLAEVDRGAETQQPQVDFKKILDSLMQ